MSALTSHSRTARLLSYPHPSGTSPPS